MLVQYVSDLHLEFKTKNVIPKLLKNIKADILVLAGDICTVGDKDGFDKFQELLKHYCPKYKYILHVAGNHEYYITNKHPKPEECMSGIDSKLKDLSKTYKNYVYLNCGRIVVNIDNKNYMFIGATLWSKVQKKNLAEVQEAMNDYVNIYICKDNKISYFNVEYMQKLHIKHRNYLKTSIDKAKSLNIPAIIITHHKSLADTEPEKVTAITQAYETDMSRILKPPVVAVIWGHTHSHYFKKENNITYASNPMGYPYQQCGFKNNLGLSI